MGSIVGAGIDRLDTGAVHLWWLVELCQLAPDMTVGVRHQRRSGGCSSWRATTPLSTGSLLVDGRPPHTHTHTHREVLPEWGVAVT